MEDPLHSDQMKATLYGNCVGDAIGLLTEFMTKDEAKRNYKKFGKGLELEHKVPDFHRARWEVGDWTDDSDQMILIMLSLIRHQGQVDVVDFAQRLKGWQTKGFPELGDFGGMGIGRTTLGVLHHPLYKTDPHEAARQVWEDTKRYIAPNGGVMRTSVLGLHQWWDVAAVTEQTKAMCKVTHADPRCQASCVAVTTAISLMLQRQPQHLKKSGSYNVDQIIKDSYQNACKSCLSTKEEEAELWSYMDCSKLSWLNLSEEPKIGYTYKCLGAGFWALKQKDFRKAIQELVMEAGDADTNCAVAGALLACKLGMSAIPASWRQGLKHQAWLDGHIEQFMKLQRRLFLEQCPEKVPESLKKIILEEQAADAAKAEEEEKRDTSVPAAATEEATPAAKSDGAQGNVTA